MPNQRRVNPPTRLTPADAGCLVDGSHTNVLSASLAMVDIAQAYGWEPRTHEAELDLALIEWARHPEREDLPEVLAGIANCLPECFTDLCRDIEDWLNDMVAPEDDADGTVYVFGWHDSDFFLASGEWWCEVAGGVCDDAGHNHRREAVIT